MDTLAHIHQQINLFLYQKSPQDFHTYLNLPREDFIPSGTTGSWSFLGKTSFFFDSHPALPQATSISCQKHFLGSCPGRFVCSIRKGGSVSSVRSSVRSSVSISVSSVCLEVAVWTCRALLEQPPRLSPAPCRCQVCRGQMNSGAGGNRW